MPKNTHITKSLVLQAIELHNPIDGYMTISDVAKQLHCDWATARKYIGMYEETRIAFLAKGEESLDHAEKTLFDVAKTDVSALKYLLSTKGKHRGYGLPQYASATVQNDFYGIEIENNTSEVKVNGQLIVLDNTLIQAIVDEFSDRNTIDITCIEDEEQSIKTPRIV